MKRTLSLLLVLVLFLPVFCNPDGAVFSDGARAFYIVVTKDESAYNKALKSVVTIEDAALNEILPDKNIFAARLTQAEVKRLGKDGGVLCVEEDITVKANGVSVPSGAPDGFTLTETPDGYEWNLQAINLPAADGGEKGSKKAKIAVLDSGVDYVSGINLAVSVNFVPEELGVSPMFLDLTGHGTAVAGVIAGNGKTGINGINPEAELYSVKVLDENNSAPVSRIVEGIYWCIGNGIDIINMSFGTSKYSYALHQAVRDAYDAGILMIGAAGNGTELVEYPAAFDQVMAVAATNTGSQISGLGYTGDKAEIAAPGEKVKAAGFFDGSVITHGTSIAVPHVTGVASLLWEKDFSKSGDFIRQLLSFSAKNIQGVGEYGLLDAAYALEIYDEFSESYGRGGLNSDLKNAAPAEDFGYINDDNNYVEGRWASTTTDTANIGSHEHLVDANKGSLSSTLLSALKKGCAYQDKDASGLSGMTENPEWHGYFTTTPTGAPKAAINYIGAFDLIRSIGRLYSSSDPSGAPSASVTYPGFSSGYQTSVKNCFNGITSFGASGYKVAWSTLLSGLTNNRANRKAFVFGLAHHTMMDSFAHSSYALNEAGTGYVRITHAETYPGYTDYRNVIPERYNCALEASRLFIDELITGTQRSAVSIYTSAAAKANGKFKLANISYFSEGQITALDYAVPFTIKYNANGGTGTMSNTSIPYNVSTATRTNTFTKADYVFDCWFAQRDSDAKWRYRNPSNTSETGWYSEGAQPSGWQKYPYGNGGSVYATVYSGDTVTFYAQWKAGLTVPAVTVGGWVNHNTAISVSWGAVSTATGYDYDVVRWEGEINQSAQTTILNASTTGTSFSIPGQPSGRYYVVRVRAKNASSATAWTSKTVRVGPGGTAYPATPYIPITKINGSENTSDSFIWTSAAGKNFPSTFWAAALCSPNSDGTYTVVAFYPEGAKNVAVTGNNILIATHNGYANYEYTAAIKVGDTISLVGVWIGSGVVDGKAYALVNGGTPPFPADITAKDPQKIKKLNNKYFRGFAEKVSVNTALAAFEQDAAFLQFKKADGTPLAGNETIGTGCTINLVDKGVTKVSYSIVVAGDITGEGLVSSADYIKLRSVLKGQGFLSGAYELAADINGNGETDAADYLLLRGYLKSGTGVFD